MKVTPEAKEEAHKIIQTLKVDSSKLPAEGKPKIKWSISELQAYIKKETAGMRPLKKMKFANKILKEIEEEKRLAKK